jgi:hypothetical protein
VPPGHAVGGEELALRHACTSSGRPFLSRSRSASTVIALFMTIPQPHPFLARFFCCDCSLWQSCCRPAPLPGRPQPRCCPTAPTRFAGV